MSERRALLPTLERIFAGPRDSVLTVQAFLRGLDERSYAFVIAALNVPNCVPTGIPLISTITGIPMILLLIEEFSGLKAAQVPRFIGGKGMLRGRLQDALGKVRKYIVWLDARVYPRRSWWLNGTPRRLLLTAWTYNIVILALPIPLDNLFPAWAILFFCLALIEGDGVMAILGWIFTAITTLWTIFLLTVGRATVIALFDLAGSIFAGQ